MQSPPENRTLSAGRGTRHVAAQLALAAGFALPALGGEIEPRAEEILRGMSAYMAGLQRFALVADASTEILLTDGRKIQLTATTRTLIDREKGIRAERRGAAGRTWLVYDGSTLHLANEGEAIHLGIPAPGGVDAALDEVRALLGTEAVGGADLLYSDPYEGLMIDVESGQYLGKAWVGGVLTEHVSYRAADIDWQLWVEADDTPAPVRYVITSKWVTAAPQFSVQVTEFTAPAESVAADFQFVPPPGSREITLEELPEHDFLAEE